MWIVLFNFCVFILMLAFFFYGFHHWNDLVSEPEDSEFSNEPDSYFMQRLPIWILIVGCALFTLAADLQSIIKSFF